MAVIATQTNVVSDVFKWIDEDQLAKGFFNNGVENVLVDVARDVGDVLVWDEGNSRWRSPADADISTGALVAGTKLGIQFDDSIVDVTAGASVEHPTVVMSRGDTKVVKSALRWPSAGLSGANQAIIEAALADNAGLRAQLV